MNGAPLRLGFIGLGIMGRPMAKHLLAKTGAVLTVANRSQAAVDDLVALGARRAATPAEVAAVSDVVFTMLPDSPDVQAVVTGPQGILAGARPGLVLVDTSSIAPQVAKSVAAQAAAVGVTMLDAPVSGGEPKAIAGTLAFMVGGDAAAFARIQPLLATMGSTVTHVGAVGSGNLTKLVNQIIVGVNIAAVAEGLVLAAAAGVDPATVVQAIRSGLAGSTVLEAKAPMMLAHQFKPGFRMGLHLKDLTNATQAAREAGVAVPLTQHVMDMLASLRDHGHAHEDHSGLVQHYEALAGVQVHERHAAAGA